MSRWAEQTGAEGVRDGINTLDRREEGRATDVSKEVKRRVKKVLS